MTWATSRFFADCLENCLIRLPQTKRSKRPFPLDKRDRLDEYLARTCMPLSFLDGLRAISVLQAVHDFAGYLEANPVGPCPPPNRIRQAALDLFEMCQKGSSTGDAGHRIFSDFPEYRWGA